MSTFFYTIEDNEVNFIPQIVTYTFRLRHDPNTNIYTMTDNPNERVWQLLCNEKHGECLIIVEYSNSTLENELRSYVYNDTELELTPKYSYQFTCTNPGKLISRIKEHALKFPDAVIKMK
ncbi:MAG TPA: hypothetical protein VLE02_01135 [Nitrosarchaeum sp.]|nr:hypothetical protein [Nitrosarchaeum sp.]